MQVSHEWLNEFVELAGITPEEISHNLTMSGLEVEEIECKKPSFSNKNDGFLFFPYSHFCSPNHRA